ncbi:MAG: helix-turn-helix domain-containing protein, partial [Cytophagales bacterium]
AEIAAQRNFTIGTIEGHLAHYVALGEIDVLLLMPANKLNTILETALKLDQPLFNALKEVLGDEYSYSDLRYAYNHKKFIDSKHT